MARDVFYVSLPSFVVRSDEDNRRIKAIALEVDTRAVWLGMMWNGSLTDNQGNSLTYAKWSATPPAAPIAANDQCLFYWRNLEGERGGLGHFGTNVKCDSVEIPTLCV